jgi:hypothetical protein
LALALAALPALVGIGAAGAAVPAPHPPPPSLRDLQPQPPPLPPGQPPQAEQPTSPPSQPPPSPPHPLLMPPAPPPADPGAGAAPADPRFRLSVLPRLARRLGEAARAVSPAWGFGIGGGFDWRYLAAGEPMALAVGVDFAYFRFATDEVVTIDLGGGMERTVASTRVLSETTFLATHSVTLALGRTRPFLTVGAGLGLGYFDSIVAELRPSSSSEAHLLGRVTAGVDVFPRRTVGLTLLAGYTVVSAFGSYDDRSPKVFGDLLDLGAGLVYRF